MSAPRPNPPPWMDRILAAAIGALIVGIVFALFATGPERVLTALLALAAASLLGAVADDLLERPSRLDSTSAPAPIPPVRRHHEDRRDASRSAGVSDTSPRSQGGREATDCAPADDVHRPRPTAPGSIVAGRGPDVPDADVSDSTDPGPAPTPRWVAAAGVRSTSTPEKWTRVGERDVRVVVADLGGRRDVVCTTCGQTVTAPSGDRPAECVAPHGSVPCRIADAADSLATDFRRLRDERP